MLDCVQSPTVLLKAYLCKKDLGIVCQVITPALSLQPGMKLKLIKYSANISKVLHSWIENSSKAV